MYSVYQLKVGNDKVYYGMTKDGREKARLREHIYDSKGHSNCLVHKAMAENMNYAELQVIQSGLSKEDALLFEDMLIKSARKLNLFTLLNEADSGKHSFKDRPDCIKKLSNARKQYFENNPEAKAKARERMKDMAKISNARRASPCMNLDTGEVFSYASDAAKSIGVNVAYLSGAMSQSKKCKGNVIVRLYMGM